MSKTFSRVLWIISGVLLILCGILCLSRPVVALAAISLFLGLSMLFSGIVDIVIFARGRDRMVGSVWFLVDGILTVLLSLFVLFDQAFTALSLPFIFGMWLLFSGVSKFVNSFDLRRLGVRGWGWFTALGVLLAFGGFFSFLDPVAGALTLSILAGALLILQGLSSILRACFSGRFLLYAPLAKRPD